MVISSSPIESDSERARIPSAMRFSASAASDGVAAPSNSNSRLSAITVSSRSSDPDQRTPGPPKLDTDVIRPLPLLGLDLEHDELSRRELNVLFADHDRELTREDALGQLGEVKRRGVPPGPCVELRRNRGGHPLPLRYLHCRRRGRHNLHGRYGRCTRNGLRAYAARLTDGQRLCFLVAPVRPFPPGLRHGLVSLRSTPPAAGYCRSSLVRNICVTVS